MRCGVRKTLGFELSVFRLMMNRNVHGRETSKVLGLLRIQCGVILALGIVLSPFRCALAAQFGKCRPWRTTGFEYRWELQS